MSLSTLNLIFFIQAYNPSFLEYILAGSFLNLAFAVDFSRSDTAVDEALVRRYVSDVELAIGAFGEPLREFQRFFKKYNLKYIVCILVPILMLLLVWVLKSLLNLESHRNFVWLDFVLVFLII